MNKTYSHLTVGSLFLVILYSGVMLFNHEGWLGIFLCVIDIFGLGYYIKKQFSKQ